MNGAETVIRFLARSGVTTRFANVGTSEMHCVGHPTRCLLDFRTLLCLLEVVATGAADGFAHMTGGPPTTLFHLREILADSLACLHNARRAGVRLVDIVGDHLPIIYDLTRL